jgi:hypothetical protein
MKRCTSLQKGVKIPKLAIEFVQSMVQIWNITKCGSKKFSKWDTQTNRKNDFCFINFIYTTLNSQLLIERYDFCNFIHLSWLYVKNKIQQEFFVTRSGSSRNCWPVGPGADSGFGLFGGRGWRPEPTCQNELIGKKYSFRGPGWSRTTNLQGVDVGPSQLGWQSLLFYISLRTLLN